MNSGKLYVDDLRQPPDESWVVARSFHHAIVELETGQYHTVSLDHDLASFYGYHEMTGRDILNWLIARKIDGKSVPSVVTCHSANPVAQDTMESDCRKYFQRTE